MTGIQITLVILCMLCISGSGASWGCPRLTRPPSRMYEDVDFDLIMARGGDARWVLEPCTLDGLFAQAVAHFDTYKHILALPDRWYSRTCHAPSEAIMKAWETYGSLHTAYYRVLEERLTAHYHERVLVVNCVPGGEWPAHGGMLDFSCEWRLPFSWGWNASTPEYCRHSARRVGNIVDDALCAKR